MQYNAPGIGGPEDFDSDFLELVAQFMEAGMNQDDAEIKAAEEIAERREMALMDAADAAHERSEEERELY